MASKASSSSAFERPAGLESELEQRFRRTVASKATSSIDFDARWPRKRARAALSSAQLALKASSSNDFDAQKPRKRPRAAFSMHSCLESELEQRFRAPRWPRIENARFLQRFGAHEAPKVPKRPVATNEDLSIYMFGGLSVPPHPPMPRFRFGKSAARSPPVVGWVVSFRFPLGSWNVLVLLLRGLAELFL